MARTIEVFPVPPTHALPTTQTFDLKSLLAILNLEKIMNIKQNGLKK